MQELIIVELVSDFIKNIQTFFGLYPTSRHHFHLKIRDYYNKISDKKIPEYLMKALICEITELEYDSYRRFWNIYPKSKKRYSEYKIEDIEHPDIHYAVIDFFKEKAPAVYKNYGQIILQMNEKQFSLLEKSKQDYYEIF